MVVQGAGRGRLFKEQSTIQVAACACGNNISSVGMAAAHPCLLFASSFHTALRTAAGMIDSLTSARRLDSWGRQAGRCAHLVSASVSMTGRLSSGR